MPAPRVGCTIFCPMLHVAARCGRGAPLFKVKSVQEQVRKARHRGDPCQPWMLVLPDGGRCFRRRPSSAGDCGRSVFIS